MQMSESTGAEHSVFLETIVSEKRDPESVSPIEDREAPRTRAFCDLSCFGPGINHLLYPQRNPNRANVGSSKVAMRLPIRAGLLSAHVYRLQGKVSGGTNQQIHLRGLKFRRLRKPEPSRNTSGRFLPFGECRLARLTLDYLTTQVDLDSSSASSFKRDDRNSDGRRPAKGLHVWKICYLSPG
jgi:hypothetical protein